MSKRTWSRLIGNDYDYFSLLKIEQLKIKRMCRYMRKHCHALKKPFVVRDLSICIRLIDIILECDPYEKKHSDEIVNKLPLTDVVYVNIKNECRFFRNTPIKTNSEKENPYRGESGRNFRDKTYKMSLRRLKAMHLYNLIREYTMYEWWG